MAKRTPVAKDEMVTLLTAVPVPRRPVARLEPVIDSERYGRLATAAAGFRKRLGGRIIWNVNSTASGGGVAEMLQGLVGYVEDFDIDIRWTAPPSTTSASPRGARCRPPNVAGSCW
jgi:hypothetical protein